MRRRVGWTQPVRIAKATRGAKLARPLASASSAARGAISLASGATPHSPPTCLPSPSDSCAEEQASVVECAWARDLFDQQLWCFGRDVVCSARGNLLLEFGFERQPHPESPSIASLYTWRRPTGGSLVLRGFGIFLGDDRWGGLFLRRRGFRPQLTPQAHLAHPLWMSDDLPRLSLVGDQDRERASRLLESLCRWLAEYELWVRRVAGVEHRTSTIAQWTPRLRRGAVPVTADEMTAGWERLASEASERPEKWLRAA